MAYKRNHFTQLPDKEEITELLASESKRAVPDEKTDAHYPDFSTGVALLEYCHLPTRILTDDFTYANITDQGFLSESKKVLDQLVTYILKNQSVPELKKLLNDAYSYLSEEDPIQKADLLFVFASEASLRTEKAIELYKQGVASKVCISGGRAFYQDKDMQPLAEKYALFAVECGVPREDIIIEPNSISIVDNVRSSLNLFDEQGLSFQKIILINAPFGQRRGWCCFKKFTPGSTELIRVNADSSEQYGLDQWYKQENTLRVVLYEFVKMKTTVATNGA